MLFGPPVPLGGHVQQICGHIAGFHTLPIHVRGMEHGASPAERKRTVRGSRTQPPGYRAPASLSVSTMLPSRARMADSTPLNHAARSYPERHPPQYFTWREGMTRSAPFHQHGDPLPAADAQRCQSLLCPFRFSVCKSVTRIRAPEAPIGCPRAMAPPLTFTLSRAEAQLAAHGRGTGRQRLRWLRSDRDRHCPTSLFQSLAGGGGWGQGPSRRVPHRHWPSPQCGREAKGPVQRPVRHP